jgi:ubiquinone/menaquinone biosynthesis C-methylase UbiE
MPLARVLEAEVLDTLQQARDYDAMDHDEVNRNFVSDLLAAGAELDEILDLGAGTAQIPIEICRQTETPRVLAVDLSLFMLDIARLNVEVAGFNQRIMLDLVDAKRLPYEDGRFSAVVSNSIVHHIPAPEGVLREAVRVTAPGGLLFFRDLRRPEDEVTVEHLVETYAAGANDDQRRMFEDSLRAALDLDEIRRLVDQLGFADDTVQMTSDRHWTWSARRR